MTTVPGCTSEPTVGEVSTTVPSRWVASGTGSGSATRPMLSSVAFAALTSMPLITAGIGMTPLGGPLGAVDGGADGGVDGGADVLGVADGVGEGAGTGDLSPRVATTSTYTMARIS